MRIQEISAALQRARKIFQRRPQAALHEDARATARWQGGTRVQSAHPNGSAVLSDMPLEFGGSGDQVSPGWLFRAGLAACSVTCIALAAANSGIELTALEIVATSRSDARGLLGMTDDNGMEVSAASRDLAMQVRIAAPGVDAQQLRELVLAAVRRSPVYAAVCASLPIEVRIDAGAP